MNTKTYLVFIGIILLLFGTSQGQNRAQIDSLKRVLETTQSDTLKAKALCDLCDRYNHVSPDTALNYGKKGLAIAKQTGVQKHIAKCLLNLGKNAQQRDDYPVALDYAQQSLKIFEALQDIEGSAGPLNSIGIVYYQQKDYVKAL